MNLIDHLEQSHQVQRELLLACDTDLSSFEEFRNELLWHVEEEESVLFTTLLALKVCTKDLKAAWAEHAKTLAHLQELDKLPMGTKYWNEKFIEFKAGHLAHLEEEEEDFFPVVRRSVEGKILRDLKRTLKKKKAPAVIIYPPKPGAHADSAHS